MGHRRSPGVQDQGHPDTGTQMPGVGGNRSQGLGGGPEQDRVDHRFVVIGDGADRCRQGEHHMVVLHRQQISLTCLEPAPGNSTLALWAVPVTTGIVGDLYPGAVVTAQHMTAEVGASAVLDCRHYLQLAAADMTRVVVAPRRPVVAEDIRNLQGRPCHLTV